MYHLYLILPGDGDSSVSKRLAEIMPYGPRLLIKKIECRNHLLRNYGTKLAAMTTNTKYPISLRKHVKANILRFRYAITKAIEYRNSLQEQSDNEKEVGKLNEIYNIFLQHSFFFIVPLNLIVLLFILCNINYNIFILL